MSTYYRLSKTIKLDDIKERCKDFEVLTEITENGETEHGQWFKDKEGNFLHYTVSDDFAQEYVTDIFRYGRNNPTHILYDIEQTFNCLIISEHDENYHKFGFDCTPVIQVNIEDFKGEINEVTNERN